MAPFARQLATASLNEAVLDTRTYDNGGRLASSVYRNGISATRVYNDDNTLAEIDHSGSIGDFTYQWDANKNKTSELITGVMASHTLDEAVYDQEDRLEEADYANKSQAWDLSLVGDWNRYTSDGAIQDRVHGPTHELLSVSQNAGSAQALAHDAKGNQTLLPPVLGRQTAMVMKWDFENKLTSADTDNDGVDDVTYQWDALQRRVRRDHGGRSAVFVQNGRQTVAEYPAGRPASVGGYRYVWGAYIDEPIARLNSVNGGLIYYHQNQQYSVIALSSSSGATIERYAYDAYGTPTVTRGNGAALERSFYGNRHTYTGREYDDALGLYHYRARMYDSKAGRFCSRDPIGYQDGESLYRAYFVLQYTDPSGLLTVGGIASALTGGGCMNWKIPLGPGSVNVDACGGVEISGCCEGGVRYRSIKVSLSGELYYQIGASVSPRKPPRKGGGARNDDIPHPCIPGKTIKRKRWQQVKERDCPDRTDKGGGGGVKSTGGSCPDSGLEVSGKAFIRAQAGIFVGINGEGSIPINPDTQIPRDLEGTIGLGISGTVGDSIDVGGSFEGSYVTKSAVGYCCE